MQIHFLKKLFFAELKEVYPPTEIQSFFNILVEFKLNLSRIEVAIQPEFNIDNSNLKYFQKAISDLKNYIPIQYIISKTEFYGLPFNVNNSVLIPRPETEELVSWIINNSKLQNSNAKLSILDVGTGSGCISISIAKNLPNAEVYALDISTEAIKIAKQNAEINQVDVKYIKADILKIAFLNNVFTSLTKQSAKLETSQSPKFDIIVSNPPYVRNLEKEEMQENVLKHEPHLALFVEDENPLLFYNKIADFAKSNLKINGQLYFEINQYLGKETVDLLVSKGFKNIELRKDIFGADRMIKASC
jgi:release factor glutamine methyltransferase